MKNSKLGSKTTQSLQSKAKKIKLLLLDVDGVLTDGRIILDNQGNEYKAFHVRDGHGIKLAQKAGIMVGIITGRISEVVNVRARELGIQEVHQGAHEKIAVYDALLSKYGFRDDEVAYIGDDIVDSDIFKRAGIAAAVADADPAVKPQVDLVTKAAGGQGRRARGHQPDPEKSGEIAHFMNHRIENMRKRFSRISLIWFTRILRLLSKLVPYRLGVVMGGILGLAAYYVLPRNRKRAIAHLTPRIRRKRGRMDKAYCKADFHSSRKIAS